MRRFAAALAVLLATGCGLPLTEGARSAGGQDERSRVPGIKVLPPGPQPGASAEDVVRGFLRAQGSPEDDHRVARQFLAPGTEWDDDAFVEVYEDGSQTVRAAPERPDRFEVRRAVTATIAADGSYRLGPPDRQAPPLPFTVVQVEGQWRLADVPDGLLLQESDLERSYVPQEVFFLGRSTVADATARLVPDRVFLPVTVEPAESLVAALVAGPSLPLRDAVESAAPAGTEARVRLDADRVVTVELSPLVQRLSTRDRQRLSAQVVWTLQDYPGVRLRVDGRPLDLPSVGELQTTGDWDEYDPAGLPADAPVYYVLDKRLRSLDRQLGDGDATTGRVPVDEAAVAPVGGRLGVVTRTARGSEVRLGTVTGPLGAPVLRGADLGSLSWGSGERGLWVLERGPAPRVWLVSSDAPPLQVDVGQPRGAGPLTRVEVSRDGSRVALVYGRDAARRLYVGRVEPTATGVAVDDVVPVAPELEDVTDVAWDSGTSLVVLATDPPETVGLLVLEVAVDGSSAAPLPVAQGITGVPRSLAAAPQRPLVVASAPEGQTSELYREADSLFVRAAAGSGPFYPG